MATGHVEQSAIKYLGNAKRAAFDCDSNTNRIALYIYDSDTLNTGFRLWLSDGEGVLQFRRNENEAYATVKKIY